MMLKFIDTHIHLQDFKPDCAPAVIDSPVVEKLVLISSRVEDLEQVPLWVNKYPQKCVGALGFHPWYWQPDLPMDALHEKLKKCPKALVGEVGVDALRQPVDLRQHWLFSYQLKMAEELSRPVIVHAAKAFEPLMRHEPELKSVRYVHHGFVKNDELLEFINRTGGYIGLGTLFIKQKRAKEMWSKMPRRRILFETDAPYRVNDGGYLLSAQSQLYQLAQAVGENVEALCAQLNENARNFLDF